MNELEKVEKLRERANVSYEEAKAALEANEWDLLDAMIALEKEGKTKAPEKSSYTTTYEEQASYESVENKVQYRQETAHEESLGGKIKKAIKWLWRKGNDNYFVVEHSGELVFKLPLWIALVLIIAFFWISAIAIIVSLFFDCHYYIRGIDNMSAVNDVMNKASNVAEMAKEEFSKKND